jgi:hypothetical protein
MQIILFLTALLYFYCLFKMPSTLNSVAKPMVMAVLTSAFAIQAAYLFFEPPLEVFSKFNILFFSLLFFLSAITLLPANVCLAREIVDDMLTKQLNGLRFCAACFYILSWYSTFYLTVSIFHNG